MVLDGFLKHHGHENDSWRKAFIKEPLLCVCVTCITQAGCCVCTLAWLITVAFSEGDLLVHTLCCVLSRVYYAFGSSNPWPFCKTEMVYLSTRLSLALYVCVCVLMVISWLGSRWDGGQKGSRIITDNSPDLLLRRTPLNKVTWYCNEVHESRLPHASWKNHSFFHWLWRVYLALHTHKFTSSE